MDVVIDGRMAVDPSLILANLRTRPGEPLDKALVEEDVRWMHNRYGLIVERVEYDPGPVVRFVLRSIRQYDAVVFEGNEEFSESALFTVARLRKDRGATPDEVAKARGLVSDHYRRKGYAFVQVDVRFSERPDGARSAVLRIYEGPEVEVDELRIEGLTALDEDDAANLLRTTPGFWAWLVGKDFVREELDRDVVILEAFVEREGYKDARVSIAALDFSDDREEVVVTLLVDQGERYIVRSMRVEGHTVFDQARLLEGARLGAGKPMRAADLERLVRSIRDLYGEQGYLDVSVDPQSIYELDEAALDLVLRIDEGRQKKVRDVIVRGNAGTRDGVIRRYLTVYPGDVVDTRELHYSEDALISLNYFSDFTGVPKVRVFHEPTPDDEYVDVVVEVDDSSSGLFSFILGAGSDSGLFGGVSIDKRNFDLTRTASSPGRFLEEFFGTGEAFHGGGQRLFLEVVPGTETTTIDITFQEPWLDESREDPWGLTTELYDRRRIFREYTQDNTGAALFFDKRLSRETSISIGPRIEQIRISDVDETDADFVTGERTEFAQAEGTSTRHVLEGAWRYNAVDSLFEPTDGFATRVRLESVGGPLGGDVDALRALWSGEWFVPMGEDDEGNVRVFHPRFALGVVEPTSGSAEDLPFFEHFFVGGSTGPFALRGFDFQGVGPHEEIRQTPLGPVLVEDDGDAVGGRLAAVASLEALFPLVTQRNLFRDREETIVKGVLFFDAGNLLPGAAFGDLADDVRTSVGAGVRLRLPALGGITIMLDWAHVLSEQEGDETRSLSFELSRRF